MNKSKLLSVGSSDIGPSITVREAMLQLLRDPSVSRTFGNPGSKKMEAVFFTPSSMQPEDFGESFESETDNGKNVVSATGMKLD